MELQRKANLLNSNYLKLLLTILVNLYQVNISLASIYTCTDEHGNVLYTDAPEKNANCTNPVQKEVKPLPSFVPGNPTIPQTQDASKHKNNVVLNDNQTYNLISLTSPKNGETMNQCGGELGVSFTSEPGLYSGDEAQLFIDGNHKASSSGNSFLIDNVDRGEHSMLVKVVRNGSVVHSSEAINFNFLRNCAKHH